MVYRLIKFLLLVLLSCLLVLGTSGLLANKGFGLQAYRPGKFHRERIFSRQLSGESSESSECPRSKNNDYRKQYQQAKERYARTRNLDEFKEGLNCAKEALNQYKTSNEKSNYFTLLLDIVEWQQDSKKQLKKESWISRSAIAEEEEIVESEYKKQIQQLNRDLSDYKEQAKKSSSLYVRLNYILNLSKIQNIELIDSEKSELSSIKEAKDGSWGEMSQTIKHTLTQLNSNDIYLTGPEKAYLFGYTGKFLLEGADIKNNYIDLEMIRTQLETYCSSLGEKCLSLDRLKKEKFIEKLPLSDLILAQICTEFALSITDDLQSAAAKPLETKDLWNISYQGYQWQWQLGRIHKLKSEAKSAIAAYSAAVQTLETMRGALLSANTEDQFTFRDEVQPVYREYISLLLGGENFEKEENEYKYATLKKVRDLVEKLQLAELENFLGCDLPVTESADNLAGKDSKDSSVAIIYPIILPDRVEVIVSLPTSDPQKRDLKHYSTSKPEQEVGQILRELRYRLELPYVSSRTKDLSKQVFKWIIKEEFWKDLNIQTLLFIPDGLLRNIPMAALEDGEGKYLIQKYAVAVSPRLQLLVGGRKTSRHSNALLAALTEKPKDQDFGKLEYARTEVEAAEEIIGKSKRLIGSDFTRFKLESEIKKGVSIVHLVTHGEFNFDKNKTFLLTDDPNPKIYLQELEDLFRKSKNPIDLLVLSACETATGDDRDTLGIAGMTVRTRARSAIASLWSIDDPATALFMKQFYKELTSGETKAQALRKSMLAMLGKSDDDQKNKHYRDNNFAYTPSQWASYVLVGDWR